MTEEEQTKKTENIIDVVSLLAQIPPVQEFKQSAIDAFSPTMKTKLLSTCCTELTLNTMVHYFHFLEIYLKLVEHLGKKKLNPWPSFVTSRSVYDLVLCLVLLVF